MAPRYTSGFDVGDPTLGSGEIANFIGLEPGTYTVTATRSENGVVVGRATNVSVRAHTWTYVSVNNQEAF